MYVYNTFSERIQNRYIYMTSIRKICARNSSKTTADLFFLLSFSNCLHYFSEFVFFFSRIFHFCYLFQVESAFESLFYFWGGYWRKEHEMERFQMQIYRICNHTILMWMKWSGEKIRERERETEWIKIGDPRE